MTNYTDRFAATAADRLIAEVMFAIESLQMSKDEALAYVRNKTVAGTKIWAAVVARFQA